MIFHHNNLRMQNKLYHVDFMCRAGVDPASFLVSSHIRASEQPPAAFLETPHASRQGEIL